MSALESLKGIVNSFAKSTTTTTHTKIAPNFELPLKLIVMLLFEKAVTLPFFSLALFN